MALLQVLKGPNPGQQYTLDRDRSIMGRHPDCDIVVNVGAVSRQHAQILQLGQEYHVEDLKSRNGTFVNGQLVEGRQKLKDNDELKICDIVFTFFQTVPKPLEGDPSRGTLLLDEKEEAAGSSTIMSKLDVSTSLSGMRVTVNPEVKLRALLEITQNLANALELDVVFNKILDSLFKVFVQADRGIIVLQDAPGGPLIPKASKHRRAGADDTIRVSRTIVKEAMEGKQAILSADAASDSRFQMSESIADFRIRSMMCAPLIISDGRALGMIQIDTMDQRTRFQQDDLDVLAAVAAQAAFAVENAKLHESAVKQKQLERDLVLAQRVQQGFLPAGPPKIDGYEFFDFYEPANQVGGDYYDYVQLPDNRLAVIVADVSGKGVAAALLMAKISAEARFWLASERDPATAIMRLNASFCRNGWEDRFVTLVMVLVDLTTHTASVVNAGHMPPYLRHDGQVLSIGEEQAGVPLGVDSDYPYECCTLPLAPGDWMAMFTDGINEAMNVNSDIYTLDRVQQVVGMPAASLPELGKLMLDDVKRFVGKHPQSDDMCLVFIGRSKA